MMLHLIARPQNGSEADLLSGRQGADLILKDENMMTVKVIPAPVFWTHDQLESHCDQSDLAGCETIDAFLGDTWVGSTEI